MSSNIKAGEAYVRVTTRDDTRTGFDKIESSFSALSRSIKRQSDLTHAAVAAAAAKSAADVARTLKAQQREIEKALPTAKKDLFAGGSGAVSAQAAQRYQDLTAQKAALQKQITAALQQQKQLEEAAAAALERQDQIQAIRLAKLRQHTEEMKRQKQLAQEETGAGTTAARAALETGANQQKIATIATTAEADKLTRSLQQQHGVVNAQVGALMQQLRTMRESGSSAAAQAPVMQTIRSLVEQRRTLEQSINQIAAVRSTLASQELAQQQQITHQMALKAELQERQAQREAARQSDGSARGAAMGIAATLGDRSPTELRMANKQIFASDSRLEGSAGLIRYSKGLREATEATAALGGSSSRAQMMIQQLIFAADDAASSFGTGGVAGAVRGAANNLTMVAALFGPVAMGISVAVLAATQLYFAFNKSSKATKEQVDNMKDLTAALKEQRDAVEDHIKLQRELSDIRQNGTSEGVRKEIDESYQQLKDNQIRREVLQDQARRNNATIAYLTAPVLIDGKIDDKQTQRRREENKEELDRAKAENEEIAREMVKLDVDDEAQSKRIDILKKEESKLRAAEKKKQRIEDAKQARILAQKERDEAAAAAKQTAQAMQQELDPFGARKQAIDDELNTRLAAIRKANPTNRALLEDQARAAHQQKLAELEEERNAPLQAQRNRLASELNPALAGQLQVYQQYQERIRELDQLARKDPSKAAEVDALKQKTMQSLGRQMLDLEKTGPAAANMGVEANTSAGIRAIIEATSGHRSPEHQTLEKLSRGLELSEAQQRTLKDIFDRLDQASVLKVENTN